MESRKFDSDRELITLTDESLLSTTGTLVFGFEGVKVRVLRGSK